MQVAFAKGEATRMGLDASKEQLPARWQARHVARHVARQLWLAAPMLWANSCHVWCCCRCPLQPAHPSLQQSRLSLKACQKRLGCRLASSLVVAAKIAEAPTCVGEEHQLCFFTKKGGQDRFPVNQNNAWICVAYIGLHVYKAWKKPRLSPKFHPEHRQPHGSYSSSAFRYLERDQFWLWNTPQPEPPFGSCQALVSLIKEGQELRRRVWNSERTQSTDICRTIQYFQYNSRIFMIF